MEGPPGIAGSARKHGIEDADLVHAFFHPIKVEELDDGLFMFVGPDRAGRMLEIRAVSTSGAPVIVHAMPTRPKYLR